MTLTDLTLVKLRLPRQALVLSGMVCGLSATTLSPALMDVVSHIPSAYSVTFFILLLLAVLPIRFLLLSPFIAISTLYLLHVANEYKIRQIDSPLTYFDIKMVLSDPDTFMNALGIYRWTWVIDASRVIAVLIILVIAWNLRNRTWFKTGAHRFLAATAVGLLGLYSLINYAAHIRDSVPVGLKKSWWQPLEYQANLSRKIGVVEYIVLSMLPEKKHLYSVQAHDQKGPNRSQIKEAASSFVRLPPGARTLPNVVIMHAESTFDPNRAFGLSAHVISPLWSGTSQTRALGPLRVSVIGAGSWVTDFEVLTGADPWLFGSQAYYTNYFVAPMIKHSFVKYLAVKGYRTSAYYTSPGWTFNYRHAFKYYGFTDFTDGPTLGMPREWLKFRDIDFVHAIGKTGAFQAVNRSSPFLYYIDTAENHFPHTCEHFNSAREFLVTYRSVSDFALNCELNEYVLRSKSTSDAFLYVLESLKSIESATGRPFVLLAFGDHQPKTFIGKRSIRTEADEHETIFHIVASEADIIRSPLLVTPPASFLPTLLSAFVASSYDDLYLPENFYLVKNCGWDFDSPSCLAYPSIAAVLQTSLVGGDY